MAERKRRAPDCRDRGQPQARPHRRVRAPSHERDRFHQMERLAEQRMLQSIAELAGDILAYRHRPFSGGAEDLA